MCTANVVAVNGVFGGLSLVRQRHDTRTQISMASCEQRQAEEYQIPTKNIDSIKQVLSVHARPMLSV